MSTETLVVILTGLGLLAAMGTTMGSFFVTMRKDMQAGHESLRAEMGNLRTDMQTGQESVRAEMGNLRTDMQTGQGSLRQEISELRSDMKVGYRSLNERIDGTNMRIDRLVDSLRQPASA